MRLKKLGAALFVFAALAAVLAGSAFATAVTTKLEKEEMAKWYTGASPGALLTTPETVSTVAVGTGTFRTESEGGVKYAVQSKKVSCIECKIENVGGTAVGSGQLKFEELSVLEPADCVTTSRITTTGLTVAANFMEGTSAVELIKFTPTKGETTAFATVPITGCALETTLVPKGNVFVSAQNETGVQAVEQEIHSSATINKNAGGSLKVGSKEASLEASAKFKLSGAKLGIAFGTH
jgi:hypothetical protein